MRILIFIFLLSISPAYAATQNFDSWLEAFKQKAAQEGISQSTINAALSGIQPIEKVIRLDRKQPEGSLSFDQYRKNTVTPSRIQKGRALMKQHHALLQEIGQKYGVQPQYIVALWGMETNFGGYTGGFSTVNSLATLAHDGRRKEFFTKELLNALQIIDQGHISAADMKGSWAGAMGQSQFMPSSFLNYAVDYNQDGRKDIWDTLPDVFASAANYLASHGWKGDQRWGRAVITPAGMPEKLRDQKQNNPKPISYWQQQSLSTLGQKPLPAASGVYGALIQPGGEGHQSYLAYENHRTLMKWNRSIYFATAVGLLADAISY